MEIADKFLCKKTYTRKTEKYEKHREVDITINAGEWYEISGIWEHIGLIEIKVGDLTISFHNVPELTNDRYFWYHFHTENGVRKVKLQNLR